MAFSCLCSKFSKAEEKGHPMKSLNVLPVLMVSVVVFAVSVCCVLYAVAEPPGRIQNQKCVTVWGLLWCTNAGNAICASGGWGKCSYCYGSTSSIPNKFCAGHWEGESCLLTGQAASFCEGGTWWMAECLGGLCVGGEPGDGCNAGDEVPATHFPCSS